MSKFTDDLVHNIMAGVPVIRVDTDEENRAILEIQSVAWRLTKGKKFDLEPKQAKLLQKAFKELGEEAQGLLDGNTLLVEGEQLHKLTEEIDPAAADLLGQIIGQLGYKIITWDIVRGFNDVAPTDDNSFAENPRGALMAAVTRERFQGHIIFVFKDCHPYLGAQSDDPLPRRVLREIVETESLVVKDVETNLDDRRTLLFLQPHWRPHTDIDHYFVQLDFELPDEESIRREIDYAEGSVRQNYPDVSVPDNVCHKLKATLKGLTQYEMANILGIAAVKQKGFSEEIVKDVQRLKAKTFEREEALTWVDPDTIMSVEQFAGFENYLEWVREAKEAYTPEAATAGIKPDKGVLLLGVPGTGKSLIAMATAKEMELPLIKFDFNSILGSFVGQSEENMRRVLRRVNAEGACVLFIDEADKAFSNVTGPQAGSNVEQHVFGQFISWMANDNKAAFIVMTMNRLKGVPIESVRSGRLSAVYYTTFPTAVEREEILRLKLQDNNCDPNLYGDDQYADLVHRTDQYVGAELEEGVKKAVKMAWKKRKSVQPTFGELQQATGRVKPVAALDAENVREINDFCKNKAEPVSKPKDKARPILGRGKRSVDLGGEPESN